MLISLHTEGFVGFQMDWQALQFTICTIPRYKRNKPTMTILSLKCKTGTLNSKNEKVRAKV